VGDRQVTCGSEACQQSRHAAQCKRWHRQNPENSAHHYEDEIKPFRERHPTYQRRWRLVVRLREIREQIIAAIAAAGCQLQGVLSQGSRVVAEADKEPPQLAAITGASLRSALGVAGELVVILNEISRVAGGLSPLG
jgi:hypothetical protein